MFLSKRRRGSSCQPAHVYCFCVKSPRAVIVYICWLSCEYEDGMFGIELIIGSGCSVFTKAGDIKKAEEVFQALKSSEQGVDEIAFSHMIHCYGTAGCLLSPLCLWIDCA